MKAILRQYVYSECHALAWEECVGRKMKYMLTAMYDNSHKQDDFKEQNYKLYIYTPQKIILTQ